MKVAKPKNILIRNLNLNLLREVPLDRRTNARIFFFFGGAIMFYENKNISCAILNAEGILEAVLRRCSVKRCS